MFYSYLFFHPTLTQQQHSHFNVPLHHRWKEITKDLNNQLPYSYDIRRRYQGVKKLNTRKKGGNLHCLMIFRKCSPRCSNVVKRVLQQISDSNCNISDEKILATDFNDNKQEDSLTKLIDLEI